MGVRWETQTPEIAKGEKGKGKLGAGGYKFSAAGIRESQKRVRRYLKLKRSVL